MTVRSFDESERKRIGDIIRKAYLEEKQSLAWTVGTIASSTLRGESLRVIIDEVAGSLNDTKLQKLMQLVKELESKCLL